MLYVMLYMMVYVMVYVMLYMMVYTGSGVTLNTRQGHRYSHFLTLWVIHSLLSISDKPVCRQTLLIIIFVFFSLGANKQLSLCMTVSLACMQEHLPVYFVPPCCE